MEQFTNLYQLSKTLRFELKPVGETAKTFKQWLEEMENAERVVDSDSNLFLKDKNIKEAYLAIKPIMDSLHEKFIEESLKSDEAKNIDFSGYFEAFKKNDVNDDIEKKLRKDIGSTYNFAGSCFSVKIKKAIEELKAQNKKDKSGLKDESKDESKGENQKKSKTKKPYECLTDAKIYYYLSAKVKKMAEQNGIDEQTLAKHIELFNGFWGYLKGYNQNRENYYEFDKEASTAVATRIVHENLPTFCSNIKRFNNRREEYLGIYQYLKDNNCEIKMKNSQGEEIDAEAISENIFQITHFNECLAQTQIELYNSVIGNYNMLINLYNQLQRGDKEFKKIDEFETLYKQIGCGKKKSMFAALIKDKHSELTEDQKKTEKANEAILTVETLLQKAKSAGDAMFNNGSNEAEIDTIPKFIQFLKGCDDWDGIYLSKSAVRKISNLYFANWHNIEDRFVDWYNSKDKEQKEKANVCITYDKKREEPMKLRDAVELSGLFAVMDEDELTEHFFKKSLFEDDDYNEYRGVLDKALKPSQNLIKLLCFDIERNITVFLNESNNIVALEKYKDVNKQAGEEDKTIKQIKDWFDAATDAMSIVRYFAVRKSKMKGNIPNSTMEIALSNLLYSDEAQWFKWYDLIRNYLTKKPQDDVKGNNLKLNFDNGTLMDGWDMNKEHENATVILRKNGMYYLGIMDTKHKNVLDKENVRATGECYEKMDYKQIPFHSGVGGFVRKCFGTAHNYGWHCPDNCLNEEGKIIIKDDEAQANLKEIIDCHKDFFDKYEKDGFKYKDFNFNFLESDRYEKLSDFYRDVEQQRYKIAFRNISADYIDSLVRDGKLYLFKIYNKDFSIGKDGGNGSTGKPNLHTIYWKMLFDENNLKDVVYKLNGESEIFMRKPVAKESPTKHLIGSKLVNKRYRDGKTNKTIPEQIYRELYLYANGKTKVISTEARKYIEEEKAVIKDVKHVIVKDKRFYGDVTKDTKYLFHCPITINFKANKYKGPEYAFPEVNKNIIDSLQLSENLQFIGIDRGEKHLVYSCTIDMDCNIIKCNHHDVINGTDYVQKLEAIADDRIIAKKNWQAQSKIKDLRDGYISHVVHSLVEEAIKDGGKIAPHAYIVLEDLSVEMKRGRQKFEKQVYQNLETALAKKLNFVVDKDAKQDELGSMTNALQLTPPINNYQDIEGKKQFGVMLYTRANYTSVTDPATGWRKTIYIKNGKEDDIKNQILDKFSDFGFDGKDYYFEYIESNAGHSWRMYSGNNGEPLPRFRNKKQILKDKNIWEPEQIDVVNILDKLFANFDKSESYKTQIENGVELQKVEGRNEPAWQSLRYAIDMIQQIRNSGEKNSKDDNFLYSPVRKNGAHFDTRYPEKNGDLYKIKDADANGAYNIARKGLIMDAHIKYWIKKGRPMISAKKDEKNSDLDLFISDREWDLWLLDRTLWEKELPTFASKSAKYVGDTPKTAKIRKKR